MLEFFEGIRTLEALKQRYHELCLRHHPDLGGDVATMQRLNAEYTELLRHGHFKEMGCDADTATATSLEDEIVCMRILEAIAPYSELLRVEICGAWLWVSGDTYPLRAILKEAGLRYASKKQAWYWHPGGYVRRWGKDISLDEIRARHGSRSVDWQATGKNWHIA